jgi:hypothetical protein
VWSVDPDDRYDPHVSSQGAYVSEKFAKYRSTLTFNPQIRDAHARDAEFLRICGPKSLSEETAVNLHSDSAERGVAVH